MTRSSWSLGLRSLGLSVSLTAVAGIMGSVAGSGCAKGAQDHSFSYGDAGDEGLVVVRADAADPDADVPAPVTSSVEAGESREGSDAGGASNASPAPVLAKITPQKAVVGTPGPMLVLTGSGFVAKSVVQLDGATLPTTFVSDGEVRAILPSAKLASVGVLHVSVGTSPPGGGASVELPFSVEYSAPTMATVAPTSVVMGATDTTITVSGASFASSAKVTFAGADLATTLVSATSLSAVIPAAKLVSSGSFDVAVVNPTPGGGASTPISFTVTNPTVSVASVTPAGALVSAPATPIALVGTGFIPASTVAFNGVAIASTFVDGAHLSATIPAGSLGATGSFPVVVTNPAPGGGVSTPVSFQVVYPVPTATGIAPVAAVAGAATAQLTVTGTGFFAATQVTFDNAPASTTLIDATHLGATLSAQQLAAAGNIAVRVVNPAPGGGTSAALAFTVNNPPPALNALSPSSLVVGSPDTMITLTGTGFVPSSVARLNGSTNLATTYASATQLAAVVPSALLASAAVLPIVVTNAAPGGGSSAPVNLSVVCNAAGVDVPLGAIGTTWSATLNFASAPTYTRLSGSGQCPTTLATGNVQPYRAIVVQNTLSSPITLSAWAICTANLSHDDDAYLTFYRRASVPATDADRQSCQGAVSEGALGAVGTTQLTSPSAGGSRYCPGLTKANGGGIALASCERAVVYIQPYSLTSTLFPPPATMYLRPE